MKRVKSIAKCPSDSLNRSLPS